MDAFRRRGCGYLNLIKTKNLTNSAHNRKKKNCPPYGGHEKVTGLVESGVAAISSPQL
jgi:hypothetical protein